MFNYLLGCECAKVCMETTCGNPFSLSHTWVLELKMVLRLGGKRFYLLSRPAA